jgi:arabinofuranosyltransferase
LTSLSAWRGPRAAALGLPGAATLLVHEALLNRPFIDDSYIFYRYASNWAHGLGPVFNRGEYVEGFSSFLWTCLLTVPAAVGIEPQRAAPVLATLLAVGCLVLLAPLTRSLIPSYTWPAVLLPIALACSPAFATYASSGMDTVLFAFVLLSVVAAVGSQVERLRAGRSSGRAATIGALLIVTLVLARAEGFIYALALSLAVPVLCGGNSATGFRQRWMLPAVAVLVTAAVFVVRDLAYGTWLPATVLAKGYVSHLAQTGQFGAVWDELGYGASYAGTAVFVTLGLVVVALVVTRWSSGRVSALPVLGTIAIVIGLAATLWNTGDWMPYRRLLVPILPILVLLGSWAGAALFARVPSPRGARLSAQLAAAGGCVLAVLSGGVWAARVASAYEARQLEGIGNVLADSPHRARLLTSLAGILPYHAGARTYVWDMLGLTDIHNAQHGQIFSPQFGRTDPVYDFGRPFDLFVSNSSWDFALWLTHADLGHDGPQQYVLLTKPRWAAIPLYVVARGAAPVLPAVVSFCDCNPLSLTAATRQSLLAGLRSKNAFPPSLLDAARSGHPFPS